MSDCKAALFYGCKTASTARASTHGVLTTQAVSNGASCSFGWNDSVDTDVATTFRERMFYFMRYGYSVKDAAANAASEMPWFDETRSYTIVGDGSITLSSTSTRANLSNQIDYSVALNMINNGDYQQVSVPSERITVYARFINNVPTLDTIEIDQVSKIAYYSGTSFTEAEIESLKSVAYCNEENVENNSFANQEQEKNSYEIYCKLNNEIKHVLVTIDIHPNGCCLATTCMDLETGNEINYIDIVNSQIQ